MTPGSLTDLDDAVRMVLAEARRLPAEEVALVDAEGRVLAHDVTAAEDVPAADNSAMDGFAVRAADTRGASSERPVRLPLLGESRAGAPCEDPFAGMGAIRISTGAVVPGGADAVIRVEDTAEEQGAVLIEAEVSPGAEIRRAGEDMEAGEVVLRAGEIVGPAELGVLASAAAARAHVVRRPSVAVLSTGDELIAPDEPLRPGAVRNSNAHSVPAQARAAGGVVDLVRMVPDDLASTRAAVAEGLERDILVLCGGVSVGPHDHVKPALEAEGVSEIFWRVALKPGKPVWFGVSERAGRRTLVFGLPGNPVSAMVTFDLFVRAAIATMLGRPHARPTVPAVLDEGYRKAPGRAHVVRLAAELRDGSWHVRPTGPQGSHVLTSMLGVDAIAVVPAATGDLEAGEVVLVQLTGRTLLGG
jgi:molybdopterin molybdotransferase